MRIVHVADSFAPDIGGIETQVEALARTQRDQGHAVVVLTAVSEPAQMDLTVVRALSGRWLTVLFPWRNFRLVAEVLDSQPVDVVHAHFTVISPLALYTARAASRRGIPVAITVHSLWWKFTPAARAALLPFGWGRIRAAWSAVSSVAAGHVRRVLPRSSDVSVVPNLVDTEWWRPGGVTADVESENAEIVVILVGRLKKRKHVDEFINALARARPRVPVSAQVRVQIVGEGPRHADLQRQIDSEGLSDWVTLLGHREPEQIRELLHRADLFVSSSRQESFGIAALEARAAGLPVLGYRGNGLSDFISDDDEGMLVADSHEMVDALTILLSDRDELLRLRKRTISTPPSVTVEQAVNSVQVLYARAIAQHPRRDSATSSPPSSPASFPAS